MATQAERIDELEAAVADLKKTVEALKGALLSGDPTLMAAAASK